MGLDAGFGSATRGFAWAAPGFAPGYSRPPPWGSTGGVVRCDRLFSLAENAITKEPGRAILSFGGVCLDSALQWWFRLLRVFPVCDCESGSVFGLIIGDRDPVTPSRHRVVPVCNSDL